MAQPVDAMQVYQGYQTANALNAMRGQQMQESAALHPLEMESRQVNILAKRMAMDDERRRNAALMQFQQTGNVNALAMADPKMALQVNAMNQRAQLARERMNMLGGRRLRPQVIQTENGPMTLGPDNRAAPILGPDNQPVKPKSLEKALPTSAAQKLMENQQNLRRAEQSVALLEGRDVDGMKGDTEATGKKALITSLGVVGDKTLNWLDPKGVDARAAIGDLGSLVIHDRSGAAVTASEFPRLRPFIPLATDSPEVALKKARRFATEYRNITQEAADFYKESGYKVPTGALRGGTSTGGASGGWSIQEVK